MGPAFAAEVRAAGMDGVVSKPFYPKTLRRALLEVRGLQPLPAWQGETQLRGLQPLPAWEAESQLRGLQPLSARQAETQVQGMQGLTAWQAEDQL